MPVIIQDSISNKVLMLGFMNEAALNKTNEIKKVTFFSRSKNRQEQLAALSRKATVNSPYGDRSVWCTKRHFHAKAGGCSGSYFCFDRTKINGIISRRGIEVSACYIDRCSGDSACWRNSADRWHLRQQVSRAQQEKSDL